MIRFKITGVSRRSSTEVPTTFYTYPEGQPRQMQRRTGAEWEEVDFKPMEEEKPAISVANIDGSAYIPNQPVKMYVHDPNLFGMYQVGDIIDFIPQRIAKEEKTIVDNIVVPQLS